MTAWQQRCRECRMRRRSGGAQGGYGREEGGRVLRVCVCVCLWECGEDHILLMLWVGPCGEVAWKRGRGWME